MAGRRGQHGPGPARKRARQHAQEHAQAKQQRRADQAQATPPTKSAPEALWTVADVQRYLQVGQRTAYELARKHIIPAVKLGKAWRFRPRDVRHYAGDDSGVMRQPEHVGAHD